MKFLKPLNYIIMKKYKFKTWTILLFAALLFTACQKDEVPGPDNQDILPEKFKVDIPDALSYQKSLLKGAMVDTLKGNDVYRHLGTFIWVGESAAEIVEDIIGAIRHYHINRPMSFSFISDDDGRIKNATVLAESSYDGVNWEFEMTITDSESEGNEDGGKAIQIFWNRSPMKGVALLKPYNIDRDETEHLDAMFRIDYSEAGEHGYDAEMLVYVSDLDVADSLEDPYSMSSLKMFAGRKGNLIDVYGNSDHPNAVLIAGNAGFTWSFVASGDNNTDLGVAELGLPPSNLDEPSRNILLGYYSVKDVITRELYEVWPDLDQESIDAYLYNASAPGYFDSYGFVSGGTAPGAGYATIEARLDYLSPYNPKEITNLTIQFKE